MMADSLDQELAKSLRSFSALMKTFIVNESKIERACNG